MIKELRRWPLDYTLLLLSVSIASWLFHTTWPNQTRQSEIALGLGLLYTSWGAWHHWRTKTLTGKVLLEYASYGLLVSLFLWLIVWL